MIPMKADAKRNIAASEFKYSFASAVKGSKSHSSVGASRAAGRRDENPALL